MAPNVGEMAGAPVLPRHLPQGTASTQCHMYGRNERTKKALTLAMNPTPRNAHEREPIRDEFVSIGAVLADELPFTTGERHDVIRNGERDEIPSFVRAAVWYRDGGRCKPCGDNFAEGTPLHLDHITPWSAGGSDTTDNLRILCARHNQERSNFVDHARPARPATWWCVNCYSREGFNWRYDSHAVTCQRHRTSNRCRVVRRYAQQLSSTATTGGEFLNWHEREPITHASVLAYCAHCDAPGLTDRPL